MRTIDWNDEDSSVVLIDQTKLPKEYVVLECKDVGALAEGYVSVTPLQLDLTAYRAQSDINTWDWHEKFVYEASLPKVFAPVAVD